MIKATLNLNGVRGKRGRGASGKQPVFGMLKRDGKVYTQIVKNCSASELIPILSEFLKESASTRPLTLLDPK